MDSIIKPCHGKYDRISQLPGNIMDNILERMSIDAAARTSILSRNWRYIWASSPKLVFDEQFFNKINTVNNKNFIQYEFPKAINKILSIHNGPIFEFSLHIPNIPNDLTSEIDQWLLVLSRNGVQKIDLMNSNRTRYNLPCCIFSCTSLIDMKLKNCILHPPPTFEGFHYLIKLYLVQVSFSAGESATLMHNLPVLRSLAIKDCTGIDHRSIYAPKLDVFGMLGCGDVYWQWFDSNQNLLTVLIALRKEVNNLEQKVNMTKFLNNMSKIRLLMLDGFALKYLAAGNLPQSQALAPTLLPSLTSVHLLFFRAGDVFQISSTLCLLKSCPNLLCLDLQIGASGNNDIELVTEYLEPSNCMDLCLEKLQTVNIKSINGLKSELLLIKLLLARSTHLQKMIIERRSGICDRDVIRISEELLRFPRSSSIAEIVYTNPLGAT